MDTTKIDWRLCAAIAFLTFAVLNLMGEGVDGSPVWALLLGFAAATGIVILRQRPSRHEG